MNNYIELIRYRKLDQNGYPDFIVSTNLKPMYSLRPGSQGLIWKNICPIIPFH
jgi:hypothetical protein